MTIFSCLAIVFLPPTLISGMFGMNVNVPWQTDGDDDNDLHAFYTIGMISILTSALLILIFYKTNLL